jgi:hypothetical protein
MPPCITLFRRNGQHWRAISNATPGWSPVSGTLVALPCCACGRTRPTKPAYPFRTLSGMPQSSVTASYSGLGHSRAGQVAIPALSPFKLQYSRTGGSAGYSRCRRGMRLQSRRGSLEAAKYIHRRTQRRSGGDFRCDLTGGAPDLEWVTGRCAHRQSRHTRGAELGRGSAMSRKKVNSICRTFPGAKVSDPWGGGTTPGRSGARCSPASGP